MKNSTNLEIFTQNESFQCRNKPISKKPRCKNKPVSTVYVKSVQYIVFYYFNCSNYVV